MAADKQSLEALHDALADDLASIIKNGATVVDKETGAATKVTAPAAYHAVALALLKHNGIQTKPLPATPMGNLVESLPFAGREVEDDDSVRH